MGLFKLVKKCTVCGENKEVHKQLRDKKGHYVYCKECYQRTHKNVTGPAMRYAMEMRKQGKKITVEGLKKFADDLAKKQ